MGSGVRVISNSDAYRVGWERIWGVSVGSSASSASSAAASSASSASVSSAVVGSFDGSLDGSVIWMVPGVFSGGYIRVGDEGVVYF